MSGKTSQDLSRQLHVKLTREQSSKLCRIAGKLSMSGQSAVVRMLVERCDERALVDAIDRAALGAE